jgi:hypothetical protein
MLPNFMGRPQLAEIQISLLHTQHQDAPHTQCKPPIHDHKVCELRETAWPIGRLPALRQIHIREPSLIRIDWKTGTTSRWEHRIPRNLGGYLVIIGEHLDSRMALGAGAIHDEMKGLWCLF